MPHTSTQLHTKYTLPVTVTTAHSRHFKLQGRIAMYLKAHTHTHTYKTVYLLYAAKLERSYKVNINFCGMQRHGEMAHSLAACER